MFVLRLWPSNGTAFATHCSPPLRFVTAHLHALQRPVSMANRISVSLWPSCAPSRRIPRSVVGPLAFHCAKSFTIEAASTREACSTRQRISRRHEQQHSEPPESYMSPASSLWHKVSNARAMQERILNHDAGKTIGIRRHYAPLQERCTISFSRLARWILSRTLSCLVQLRIYP